MSNTDRPIISVGTSMDDNTPSDELVVSIDMPEIVGVWDSIDAPIYSLVVPENLAETVNSSQRPTDAGPLDTDAVFPKKSHSVSPP